MIGSIRGQVQLISKDSLILDVNGVGYQIMASASILEEVRQDEELFLQIFTDVRETDISLYGFREATEKEVFLMLRKVKGIGSKLAMAIVDMAGANGVLSAIGIGDSSYLCKVPGVGKKTAERILVELKEQVAGLASGGASTTVPHSTAKASLVKNAWAAAGKGGRNESGLSLTAEVVSPEDAACSDALQALEKLGFSPQQARLAVGQAVAELDDGAIIDSGEVLRKALSGLR